MKGTISYVEKKKSLFQFVKNLIKERIYVLWALFFPFYTILFFSVEKLINSSSMYWETSTFIDGYIPFIEEFVIGYYLWYPIMAVIGLYLFFKDEGCAFRRYVWFMALGFITSEIICLTIPNGQDLRPLYFENNNIFTYLVSLIYSVDTNTNVFPSVHVVGTLGVLFATFDSESLRNKPFIKTVAVIIGTFVILSTVFIKQHAVIDVIAGIILSTIVYLIIYLPQKNPRKIIKRIEILEEKNKNQQKSSTIFEIKMLKALIGRDIKKKEAVC